MPFARMFCDLHEEMKANCLGQPGLPAELPLAVETFRLFQETDATVWPTAGLPDVFNYLRKSKRLVIPSDWKHLVPTRMDE